MKKIMYILALVLMISFVSCNPDYEKNQEKRIKVKACFSSTYSWYEIIEVDGQEYLSNSRGGIIKLEKKVE